MTITRTPLSRRTMLRGVGTMIALPVLDAMMPALASAAPLGPKRLSIFYMPNGMVMESFVPAKAGADYALTPILEPLAGLREKMTVISGLMSTPGTAMGDGGGDHGRACGSYLTATHPKKTEGYDILCGVSMDQYVAKQYGKETQIQSLELGIEPPSFVGSCDSGYSCAYTNTMSWSNPTTPLPTVVNPREVFERLFGDSDKIDQATRLAQFKRDASILDFVMEDAKRMSPALSIDDHRKMDEYLTSVRDLERRIQLAEKGSGQGGAFSDLTRPAGVPDDFNAHVKMMIDLQVLAMKADLTRVTSFMIGREGSQHSYTELGIPDAHHSLSHHGNDPEKLAKLVKIQAHLMGYFKYYLEQLQAAKEGDSNLFERTLAWGGASLGDSNRHDHLYLPTVIAGGLTAGNRHIAAKDTPLANLMVSVMQTLDVRQEKIGDSTGFLAGIA
jgi:hypothetical protein